MVSLSPSFAYVLNAYTLAALTVLEHASHALELDALQLWASFLDHSSPK